MDTRQRQNGSICSENPSGCFFRFSYYEKGAERTSYGLEQHVLLFCKSGHIRITSNLFKEEFLCAGEILFVPRGSDYHGVALSDAVLLVHTISAMWCVTWRTACSRSCTAIRPLNINRAKRTFTAN